MYYLFENPTQKEEWNYLTLQFHSAIYEERDSYHEALSSVRNCVGGMCKTLEVLTSELFLDDFVCIKDLNAFAKTTFVEG